MWSNLRFFALGLTLVFAIFTAACGSDEATATSCSVDDDCALGTVCGASNTCIEAACDFCTGDQICYVTDENPQGTCSKPECTNDDDCEEGSCVEFQCSTSECVDDEDCGAGQTCTLAGTCEESSCSSPADCPTGQYCASGSCEDGCDQNEDCGEGEACNASTNECESGCMSNDDCDSGQTCDTESGACVCTPGECPAGSYCDDASGACVAATDCSQITCPQGEVCNSDTLECEAGCTPGSCAAEDPNTICDQTSGQCVQNTCPGEDPTQCDGDPNRPVWDAAKCFCAECLSDDDCPGTETCTSGGVCFECTQECDPMVPGQCGGSTPYCIDECCVSCVGAADCAEGEICIDGSCAPPPNCTADPSVCPTGYNCDANGECQPPMQGGACSPDDPTTCPQGTFCDPTTLTCGLPGGGGPGGGGFCGLCNADCTCPNGLNCNGFLCDGCAANISITDPTGGCPSGDVCLPLGAGICFPLL